jgi:hypothetical protein
MAYQRHSFLRKADIHMSYQYFEVNLVYRNALWTTENRRCLPGSLRSCAKSVLIFLSGTESYVLLQYFENIQVLLSLMSKGRLDWRSKLENHHR